MISWGVAHSQRVFKSSTRFRPDLNIKSKTIDKAWRYFVSNLLVLVISMIMISCSSLEGSRSGEKSSPGYQFGRQMDERTLKAGFMER